jgi:hypothetical protein
MAVRGCNNTDNIKVVKQIRTIEITISEETRKDDSAEPI